MLGIFTDETGRWPKDLKFFSTGIRQTTYMTRIKATRDETLRLV